MGTDGIRDDLHLGSKDSPRIALSRRCLCIAPLCIAFILTLMTGCGTLGNGRGWGEDAVYPVNPRRVSSALKGAFLDWGTWVPAGGAVIGSFDHFDERASEWGSTRNPIFGSRDAASRASNYLLYALEAEVFLTALATPSGDDPRQWALSKAKGLSVELGAELATAAANSWRRRFS